LKLEGKNLFRIFLDTVLLSASFVLATIIRLEGQINSVVDRFIWQKQIFTILPLVVILQITILFIFGNYRRFWRYTTIRDIISLAKSLSIASGILLIPRLLGLSPKTENILAISYGILAIDFLLALGSLAFLRIFRAYLIEQKNIKKRLQKLADSQKPTLVVGGGEAGIEVIKSIQSHPELGLKIVGILDDDEKKHGMKIMSVKVLGPINNVAYYTSELDVDQIIIAIPSLNNSKIKEINKLCIETGADVRTIPGVDQLAGGKVNIEEIRKLSMEDLLGRDEINLDTPEINKLLSGKKVLVTGAGGSIGRELCLQLAKKSKIKSICLLGKGENSIFEIYNELKNLQIEDLEIVQVIADIKNYSRIDSVFETFKPEVVFHAAAHKHVYLMELNACEAFENNVIGTRNIAALSGKHQVGTFVLISTDKAVNPTSIMGSTKNLAEKVVLHISKQHPLTKFTAVRFGNVLGSRGSVIKVWEKQLQQGLPLTVTHKEVIRYFMTIPEATQLVIQAAAKAESSEVMLLDMGEPVRIYDLAEQFIKLSGFDIDDVGINITGLKEGEKLYEELLTSSEFVESKLTDKIFKAKIDSNLSDDELVNIVSEIETLARENKNTEVKRRLRAVLKAIHR
jgi:FlaA1/EpsC-like NDP-sugar epimerase